MAAAGKGSNPQAELRPVPAGLGLVEVLVYGGLAITSLGLLALASPPRTMGATRSFQLERQRRQEQVEGVLRSEERAEVTADEGSPMR
jgi:hypothetical protein